MKELLKEWRLWVLAIALILAFVAIMPIPQDGVAIRGVIKESPAAFAGVPSPPEHARPLDYEVIKSINGQSVRDVSEYLAIVEDLQPNTTISIRTDQSSYFIDLENTTDLGIGVSDAADNNIRKGLDLQGGVRVLLQPDEVVTPELLERAKDGLEERLNAFGLNDVVIRTVSDLSGNDFIQVEIAGLQEEEIREILEGQGKFEAKINNQTVFTGEDVTYVCRTAECSGLDPQQGCQESPEGTVCSFFFSITLNNGAAEQVADATRELPLAPGGRYLNATLDLYLDESLVSDLQLGASLKGRPTANVQISGPGYGATRELAQQAALQDMKQLQAVLETGSLPVNLEIVKIDTLSPILGDAFLKNAIITGLAVLAAVGVVIYARYRTLKIVVSMMLTNIAEIVLLLGAAALFGTNLDLAAIAGIILVVGTGVDDQIVIVDEVLRKGNNGVSTKKKIKDAFFIIFAAFFTMVVAMLPLWFAGAGILRGFATTTIYGILIGVLITRPAYAAVIEKLVGKEE